MNPAVKSSVVAPVVIGTGLGATMSLPLLTSISPILLVAMWVGCPVWYYRNSQLKSFKKVAATAAVTVSSLFLSAGIFGAIMGDSDVTDNAIASSSKQTQVQNKASNSPRVISETDWAPKLPTTAETKEVTPILNDAEISAYRAFRKYRYVKEASLPEVRQQAEAYKPDPETLALGVNVANEYGTHHQAKRIDAEAKDEVLTMDNNIRSQKIEKFIASGTTISAKSNYELIKQLQPTHPAVSKFASHFDEKPELQAAATEEPVQAVTPPKPAYKTRAAALREVCEAGKEYSQDGFGTPQQIAHELAYWVIDLHRQSGGKATEAELRNAGSQGYMFENCSKYS